MKSKVSLHKGLRRYDQIMVTTGAGHGSDASAVKIRRIETAHTSLGRAITVTHSATLGTVFTINATGVYAIEYGEQDADTLAFGISRNTTQGDTNLASIADADRLANASTHGAADTTGVASWTGVLNKGDKIRPHTDGSTTKTTNLIYFNICKISD